MFNPTLFHPNPKPYNPESSARKPRDNLNNVGPSHPQGVLPLRSKSTNMVHFPMPINEGHGTTRVEPLQVLGKVHSPINSHRKIEIRNTSRLPEPNAFEQLSRRMPSVTPEKKEDDKQIYFRTPEITRSKGNLEPLSSQPGRLSYKGPSQNNHPIKPFNSMNARPGIFNEGLLLKPHEVNNANFLGLRSRKDQFNAPIPNESFPNLRRITPVPQNGTNHLLTPFKEKDFPPFGPKPNSKGNDFKLPKLENFILTRRLEQEQSPKSGQFDRFPPRNFNPQADALQSLDGNRKPPRGKIKSYDRYDPKHKSGQGNELLDPRFLLNQPQILSRRKPSESSIANFPKFPVPEQTERTVTPVKTRTPSTVIKTASPSITLEDYRDTKMILTFNFKSKAGSLPSKPIKTNQDAYIVHPNFAGHKDKYIFGVCDGHGVNGHMVSNYIKQQLPRLIENQYKTLVNEEFSSIKEAMTTAFHKTNNELFESTINVDFSGSTTVITMIFGNRLWCANVGDSRAIVAKYRNGKWMASPLSNDHKPELPKEKERIIASGGRVEAYKDNFGNPIGPCRVWLKDENIPGLAMSRSLGDGVAARAGCIPDPEILQFDLEEEDKFIVIASDGVWEFLSNQQVVDFIVPHYNRNHLEAGCEKVIKESTLRWKEEDEVVDDITCVIIGLRVQQK